MRQPQRDGADGRTSRHRGKGLRAVFSWRLLLALATAGAFTSPTAAQDDCPQDLFRGPKFVTPADGAGGVTVDAPLVVEFFPEDYFTATSSDPMSALSVFDEDDSPVAGQVQVIDGHILVFLPEAPWAESTSYAGTATGVDGVLDFEFTTGREVDLGPPLLGEIEAVATQGVDASCDFPDGGTRVDVSFRPAVDDGPQGSIEYLLFLTRGVGVSAPRLAARTRGFSTQLVTMSFVLDDETTAESVCVVVQAVDGVGFRDDNGVGACFDPVTGGFFQSLCRVGASRDREGSLLPGVLLGFCLIGRAMRRRRAIRGSASG